MPQNIVFQSVVYELVLLVLDFTVFYCLFIWQDHFDDGSSALI